MKSLHNLGRLGASKAVKSDFAKPKIKGVANKYSDQALDSLTSNLSWKLNLIGSGSGLDIHKAVGKLPRPKSGFTLPGHHYTGPYNPLEQQVKFNPKQEKFLKFINSRLGKLMLLLCNTTWIILFAEITESVKTKQTERWSKLWIRFPGTKDSGAMPWQETLLTRNRSYD